MAYTDQPGVPNHLGKIYLGRHIYGLAAIFYGVISIAWHNFNDWRQILPLGKVAHLEILLYIAAATWLIGGLAIQWAPTRRIGALALGGIYFIFALLWVPQIVASPLTYAGWGSFFEQFSLVSGALVVFGASSPRHQDRSRRLARIGYVFFGVCVTSFAVAQVAYLSITVKLVPKWIPPGQKFWAIATTIAFALAAVALLSGRLALLASRLLTTMLIAFGLLIWIPVVASDPRTLFNWTENAENLAIAGAAWIVADFLAQNRSATLPA